MSEEFIITTIILVSVWIVVNQIPFLKLNDPVNCNESSNVGDTSSGVAFSIEACNHDNLRNQRRTTIRRSLVIGLVGLILLVVASQVQTYSFGISAAAALLILYSTILYFPVMHTYSKVIMILGILLLLTFQKYYS